MAVKTGAGARAGTAPRSTGLPLPSSHPIHLYPRHPPASLATELFLGRGQGDSIVISKGVPGVLGRGEKAASTANFPPFPPDVALPSHLFHFSICLWDSSQ